METIEYIVKQLCQEYKNIEFVILESPSHYISFQPNYEHLNVGEKDLFDNIVVKKMSYYANEENK